MPNLLLKRIDELPLNLFRRPYCGPRRLVPAHGSHRLPGRGRRRFEEIGHDLSPGEIVLFAPGRMPCGGGGLLRVRLRPGEGGGAAPRRSGREGGGHGHLWSLDRPYPLIGGEWKRRRDPSLLWPAHFAGIEREYCQIEKLTHLSELPAVAATLLCMPVKVEGASGVRVRAVGHGPLDD